MVDDNRGYSSPSSSNPGAYAAHLVTVKHGTFAKLPPAPSYFQWSAGLQTNLKSGISSHWKLDASLDGRSSSVAMIGGGTMSQSQSQHHRSGGSKSGSGSHTGWFGTSGTNETNIPNNNNPSSNSNLQNQQPASDSSTLKSATATGAGALTASSSTTATTSLGTLPRMSCVTYHPNTGFVYALTPVGCNP
mmetsp:Transcript_2126/g.4646  ORF Transcript_2126/g.4646 Transcript_2126/m.4646 type:complete len:190 (+) Transcript_2126:1-570(+)